MPKALGQSASQTAGPYVHIGLAPQTAGFDIYQTQLGRDIAGPNALGERITVQGRVFDGAGDPVTDAVLEVWHANSAGQYAHSEGGQVEAGFRGWGRSISDLNTGEWSFETVKPGGIADANGVTGAPHINIWIVARGINIGLNTRLYFSDENVVNAHDPVLSQIMPESRRATLVATRTSLDGRCAYRFDIHIQGDDETVFFDV